MLTFFISTYEIWGGWAGSVGRRVPERKKNTKN